MQSLLDQLVVGSRKPKCGDAGGMIGRAIERICTRADRAVNWVITRGQWRGGERTGTVDLLERSVERSSAYVRGQIEQPMG